MVKASEKEPVRLHQAARSTGEQMVELRGNAPRRTIDVIDAISIARSMSRTDLVNEILEEWVVKTINEAMVVERAVRGNGSHSGADGSHHGRGRL